MGTTVKAHFHFPSRYKPPSSMSARLAVQRPAESADPVPARSCTTAGVQRAPRLCHMVRSQFRQQCATQPRRPLVKPSATTLLVSREHPPSKTARALISEYMRGLS